MLPVSCAKLLCLQYHHLACACLMMHGISAGVKHQLVALMALQRAERFAITPHTVLPIACIAISVDKLQCDITCKNMLQ